MPTFPTCPDKLPEHLHIFNPSHYLLLAYWIYFRPTHLKCYFHQSLPDLYSSTSPAGFFKRWGSPAYRNVYIMMLIASILLTFLCSLPVVLFASWRLQASVKWAGWLDGVMLGVTLGVTLGVAVGMVGRIVGGVALGSIVGVVFGVTIGIAGGMTLSLALGISYQSILDGAVFVGAVFGMTSGMVFTLDIEIGVALSLAFAVMGGASFGAEFLVFKTLGVRFGALLARGAMSGAFVAGAFRMLFYPFQCGLACGSLFSQHIRHPLEWDDLTILPLPFTRTKLMRRLRDDEQTGLRFLINLGRNLFRRQALRWTLYHYLHSHVTPLQFLYHLLTNPAMDEYLLIPISSRHAKEYLSVRHVFLGELGLRHVEAAQNPRFRRSSWWLNLWKQRRTPLSNFAQMLYELLDERTIHASQFELSAYRPIYTDLTHFLHGQEIAHSYDTIAAFLSYQHISELAQAEKVGQQLVLNIFFHDALRPTVLKALAKLGHIGADIGIYTSTENRTEQLAMLAHITGELNELQASIHQNVMAPEQFLLQRIIRQWQQLVLEAIGILGKYEHLSYPPHEGRS